MSSVRSAEIATVVDLLLPDECDAYIRFSESVGYLDAPITTASGPVMAKRVRNNDRAMIDDSQHAALSPGARALAPLE